jgi:hypothetical protein
MIAATLVLAGCAALTAQAQLHTYIDSSTPMIPMPVSSMEHNCLNADGCPVTATTYVLAT